MKFSKLALIVVGTITIEVSTTFIRYQSIRHDFWISFMIYCIFTYLWLSFTKVNKNKVLLTILATITALAIVASVVDQALPEIGFFNIIGTLVASVSAYLFYINRSWIVRLSLIVTSISICVFYVFFGFDLWLNYINFGNLTGAVNEQISAKWLINIDGDIENQKKGKITVLDFFTVSCGVCYAEFPYLQKDYSKYSNNENVSFIAVNIPYKRDSELTATDLLKGMHYTFPIVIAHHKEDSIFKIHGYPTVLIIRGNSIFYRGDIYGVDKAVQKLLADRTD